MKEVIFAIVFLFVIFLIFKLKPKKRKLSKTGFEDLQRALRETQKLDPSHGIIESHKIFVQGLKSLIPSSQNKTAAEIVTLFQGEFKNTKKVWQFHGRRNQVAHEVGIEIKPKEALECRNVFIAALKDLM